MKSAAEVLADYDALYGVRNPDGSIRHIIDGDEAQLAADLAALVRAQPDAYQQGLEDRPVVDAAVEAVKSELQYAAHEAIHGDSKAVQQVDEFLQQTRRAGDLNTATDPYDKGYVAGIKATMEHLKRQPR